jgi:arabinogalactan oligomer / maltooligosaccharide transport system permease protein
MDNQPLTLQSNLEYLSLSPIGKIGFKIRHFFKSIPKNTSAKARKFSSNAKKTSLRITGIFRTIVDAMVRGDIFTRLSFLFMGTGLIFRHQIIRGLLYLAYECFFIFFMIMIGGSALSSLPTLGTLSQFNYKVYEDVEGLPMDISTKALVDNSFTILLYYILSIVFILILVFLWYNQIRDSFNLQQKSYIGKYASDQQTLRNVLDKSYDKTLLFIPIGGLCIFTIIPIVMMVLIGFTDYDYQHVSPTMLFDWVGLYNLSQVFSTTGMTTGTEFLKVFAQVLLWTLLWAFFATFSNYFVGMVVAMIINTKGIKLKKVWRTILISTIAVPQFISLMLVSYMFSDSNFGIVNSMLQLFGWTSSPIKWLSDSSFNALLPKVMIVLINTWIGIPYTMLICTGLLMNIPEDLYESARIDGASPVKMYMKITLPYMLFVTGPYLLSQFIGNINNFNVIYLLSGGGPYFSYGDVSNVPASLISSGVGQTDLLITWIYKLTTNKSYDYGLASVLGVLVFVLVAFFSLIFYGHSSSVNNEEAFQ